MSDRPLISVHDLAKRYGGVVALDGHEPRGRARHHPRGGRRERRRQIDADEGAGRRRPPRCRRDPPRRPGAGDRFPSRPQARHRHRLSGAEPVSRSARCSPISSSIASRSAAGWSPSRDGGREPRPARPARPPCRCRRAGQPAQHRRAAAGRALPRAAGGAAAAHPRRAELGAERARDRAALRGAAAAARSAASPCSTSRTGWRRSSPSPTASPSPATAATC